MRRGHNGAFTCRTILEKGLHWNFLYAAEDYGGKDQEIVLGAKYRCHPKKIIEADELGCQLGLIILFSFQLTVLQSQLFHTAGCIC